MNNKIDLHVHPYFERYGIESIVEAMRANRIKVIGLINYNEDNFDEARKNAERIASPNTAYHDNLLIKIQIGEEREEVKYLLRGIEVLNDDFHLLVIGDTKGVKLGNSLEKNIETGMENGALVIIDHPFVDALHPRRGIDNEKRKKLADICKEYPVALEWNGYCSPRIRKFLGGNDANLELKEFVNEMHQQGIKIPIIADSDVHARNKRLLKGIGRGNFSIATVSFDISNIPGQQIINQIKNGIKIGDYSNNMKYASFLHFAEAFGLPYALNMAKNRG